MNEKEVEKTAESSEDQMQERLSEAAKGLWYISETDAEIFPFTGSKSSSVTAQILLESVGLPADTEVEERGFDEMLERFVSIKDWHSESQRETASRWAALKELMTSNLTDLRVFKIGDVRRDVYFVGLGSDGRLRGIKTFAVET